MQQLYIIGVLIVYSLYIFKIYSGIQTYKVSSTTRSISVVVCVYVILIFFFLPVSS